jgi:hypothetical protein
VVAGPQKAVYVSSPHPVLPVDLVVRGVDKLWKSYFFVQFCAIHIHIHTDVFMEISGSSNHDMLSLSIRVQRFDLFEKLENTENTDVKF